MDPRSSSPAPVSLLALVFHELLHTYVPGTAPQAHRSSWSATSVKSRREKPPPPDGRHEDRLLKMGREEQLKQIIETDRASGHPAYARAWQIVNDIEGHDAFVHELRQ